MALAASHCRGWLRAVLALVASAAGEEVATGTCGSEDKGIPSSGQCGSSLLQRLRGPPPSLASTAGDVDKLLEAMQRHGATVHPGLREGRFEHGGHEIRGLYTVEQLSGQPILEIPRSLWITADVEPELANLDLAQFPACEAAGDFGLVKEAASLFLESLKGEASVWSSFVSSAPTMAQYQSFMVVLADQAVQQEFAGLGAFINLVRLRQEQLNSKNSCLMQVRDHVGGGLAAMTPDDGMRWLLVGQTRRYKVFNHTALIPISDMMNTANAELFNTHWHGDHRGATDYFIVEGRANAGDELYDEYCRVCHNGMMLLTWGIYLDGNPNSVDGYGADCSSLQVPVAQLLDLQAVKAGGSAFVPPFSRPRCVSDDARRCNLALLAYEVCGGASSNGVSAMSLITKTSDSKGGVAFDLERALRELDHMAIGYTS